MEGAIDLEAPGEATLRERRNLLNTGIRMGRAFVKSTDYLHYEGTGDLPDGFPASEWEARAIFEKANGLSQDILERDAKAWVEYGFWHPFMHQDLAVDYGISLPAVRPAFGAVTLRTADRAAYLDAIIQLMEECPGVGPHFDQALRDRVVNYEGVYRWFWIGLIHGICLGFDPAG